MDGILEDQGTAVFQKSSLHRGLWRVRFQWLSTSWVSMLRATNLLQIVLWLYFIYCSSLALGKNSLPDGVIGYSSLTMAMWLLYQQNLKQNLHITRICYEIPDVLMFWYWRKTSSLVKAINTSTHTGRVFESILGRKKRLGNIIINQFHIQTMECLTLKPEIVASSPAWIVNLCKWDLAYCSVSIDLQRARFKAFSSNNVKTAMVFV